MPTGRRDSGWVRGFGVRTGCLADGRGERGPTGLRGSGRARLRGPGEVSDGRRRWVCRRVGVTRAGCVASGFGRGVRRTEGVGTARRVCVVRAARGFGVRTGCPANGRGWVRSPTDRRDPGRARLRGFRCIVRRTVVWFRSVGECGLGRRACVVRSVGVGSVVLVRRPAAPSSSWPGRRVRTPFSEPPRSAPAPPHRPSRPPPGRS